MKIFLSTIKGRIIAVLSVLIAAEIIAVSILLFITGNRSESKKTGNHHVSTVSGLTVTTNDSLTETDTEETDNEESESEKSTQKLQKNINIFMSNFSEAYMDSFSGTPSQDYLISFGFMHCHLNEYTGALETCKDWVEIDGYEYHEKIKCSKINEAAKKYFGQEIDSDSFRSFGNYKDGYMYCDCTGGYLVEGFSVVHELTETEDGLYSVEFIIYDQSGMYEVEDIYSITPEDMKSGMYDNLTYELGRGSAIVEIGDISDRKTYILREYDVTRY